jgi:hypothetical protein
MRGIILMTTYVTKTGTRRWRGLYALVIRNGPQSVFLKVRVVPTRIRNNPNMPMKVRWYHRTFQLSHLLLVGRESKRAPNYNTSHEIYNRSINSLVYGRLHCLF